jgi:tetratricopeptide (TPR) repeat protein
MNEESYKRWLAVLIAGVALSVAITTFLQNQASNHASVLTRQSQEAAILATGEQTRGQQRVAFDRYGILTLTDELYAYAIRNGAFDKDPLGRAYLDARAQLQPLSPLLSSDYTKFDDKGFRTETDFGRYEADTYLVQARLYDEERSAYAQASSQWNSKGDAYVAMLAILSLTLFLFALAGTVGGLVRWMFVVVGLCIWGVSLVWLVATVFIPVHQIPESALNHVAQGAGYAAQATDYYFVGQGIAGMPLTYDVTKVSEPTDIYKTNADQYAQHTNEFWQKAIDSYSQAINLDATYANAYIARGIARRMIQPAQTKDAQGDLQAAITNGARDYSTYWNLGLADYYVGNYDDAILASRRALDLNERICGPAFTIALATLAEGKTEQAGQAYENAITRCNEIYQAAVQRRESPPDSLLTSMESGADELENLICVLNREQYCYANRNLPQAPKVAEANPVVTQADALRKRIKEAETELEYAGTTAVKPTGAKFAQITFGYYMINPNKTDEFLNYAAKKVFPYNEYAPDIDSFSSYTGMSKDDLVVWKVRHNGVEDTGLRYSDKWNLETDGPVVKRVNSWYVLLPGLYELEVYVNGEMVQTGSFEISPQSQLTNTLPVALQPSVPLNVNKLYLDETYDNNNANWWTGSGVVKETSTIDGELTMLTTQPDHAFTSSCTPCGVPFNFYMEADTRYVQGPTDAAYGLIYRGQVNLSSFYAFLISPNGEYLVAKYNGSWTRLIDWTPSNLLNQEGKNKLGVLCKEAHCDFYINGTHVNSADDDTLNGQFIGVRVDRDQIQAAFDNVAVWSLE